MTNNLGRIETTSGQTQKEVTLNASDGDLDAALTGSATFDVDDSNVFTLSTDNAQDSLVYQFDDDASPPTDLVVVTYPAVQRGLFVVFNNMTFPMSIGISAQSATPPVVDVGETRILQCDGVDVLEVPTGKPNFHGALVNISGTQSIADVTDTNVGWDVEVYDHEKGRNQFWLGVNAIITTDFATDDRIDLTAHGMETADGPFQFTTVTTLPAGISLATDYWAIKVSADEFEIATSIANALAGTQVDITDDGTGAHTIDRETRLVVPIGVTKVCLQGAIEFAVNATGDRHVEILKNGAAVLGGGAHSQVADAQFGFMGVGSATLEVTAGDFFDMQVHQSSTGALNLLSANSKTWFSIEEVR